MSPRSAETTETSPAAAAVEPPPALAEKMSAGMKTTRQHE